ncbi:MAG: hypothetical protein K1X72_07140 [Pyrinomonadaceae bacterium]|nr:hypothetical protein [Pyrinomonadaceae bacterium]
MSKMILKSLMLGILIFGYFGLETQAQTQPTTAQTEMFRNKPCLDPWINFVYAVEFNRLPVGEGNSGECAPTLYRDGKWSNYKELRDDIVKIHGDYTGKLKLIKNDSNYILVFKDFDQTIKLGIVGSNAGALISKDGAGLISTNGAKFNLINNPNNIIAPGGGNVINGNGSTIVPSTVYNVQSAGAKKVIKLKNGATVIIR